MPIKKINNPTPENLTGTREKLDKRRDNLTARAENNDRGLLTLQQQEHFDTRIDGLNNRIDNLDEKIENTKDPEKKRELIAQKLYIRSVKLDVREKKINQRIINAQNGAPVISAANENDKNKNTDKTNNNSSKASQNNNKADEPSDDSKNNQKNIIGYNEDIIDYVSSKVNYNIFATNKANLPGLYDSSYDNPYINVDFYTG